MNAACREDREQGLMKRSCGSLPERKTTCIVAIMLSEEDQFRALKLLERNPSMTQREIAVELGVSVGKAHYVVTELINLGWLKLRNFRRSDNKLGYSYLLTPRGIIEKAAVTARFLARKQDEYEALRLEIEQLKAEVADAPVIPGRR